MKKWSSKSTYVDVETGEILNKKKVTESYVIIKTIKYYKNDKRIEYIRQCKETRQQKLW